MAARAVLLGVFALIGCWVLCGHGIGGSTVTRKTYTLYHDMLTKNIHKALTSYSKQSKKNFWSAYADCYRRDMQFASITSKKEHDEINNLVKQSGRDDYPYWIGGYSEDVQTFWWLSTGKPFTYTKWINQDGKPNQGQKYCACLSAIVKGTFANFFCDEPFYYACETEDNY